MSAFKDHAYFCYCAYFLPISRYLGFLRVVATNAGIFLCGLKLCGESRTWYPKRKLGVTMHFSEIIKLQVGKNAMHSSIYDSFLELLLFKKSVVTPSCPFGFQ